MKKLAFILLNIVLATTQHSQAQIQIGQDIDGEAAGDQSGYSVSMPDSYTVAIGAYQNRGNGLNSGHVSIYQWNGSTSWSQKGIDIDSESSWDYSGFSVSMPDANTVAIGAIGNTGNGSGAGHVRIYTWNGSVWSQKGADIDGEATGDKSGYSVSMPDTNTVAIGAHWNDGNGTDAGHVRIYQWNGSAWTQKGADIDGEAVDDNSGCSISMPDANTVAIGAFWNDGNGISAGHVRIYQWNGSAWTQKGADIEGETAYDLSGSSISMPDPHTIAIGAYENDGNGSKAGHVRIYEWNGSAWTQKGTEIDGEAAYDESGKSVSMPDANTLAIGAHYNAGNGSAAGHVRIYQWNGSTWTQKGVDIDGEAAGDRFGFSVSMPDINTVAIGARRNGGNGVDAGHVRVYKLKGVGGIVYNDINQNCIKENESLLAGRKLEINPGNIIVETNESGYWYIDSLPAGNYTITADTLGNWKRTCDLTQSFTILNPDSLYYAPSFGFVSTTPCAEPEVSVNMPRMRPGFSNQPIYIQACNEYKATGALYNGYIELELDPLIIPQSASVSYTNLGGNKYKFVLPNDTLNPGQCEIITMNCSLSTSAILNSTLCIKANLYPADSCVFDTIPNTVTGVTPCTLPWDKSSLKVTGKCTGDSIRFVVYNHGSGSMQCYAPVRIYVDGVLITHDSIMLTSGDSAVYTFLGDGRTWRLEADQHPLHPGRSRPNATVENCNPGNWTPNLVNVLPQDDADPVVDIYCEIVTGSYDPNDKTGYPLGINSTHDIMPNQQLEYVIRFQNTGTDTAFTVVIRDTLDTDLDIFSVVSGASSHKYNFRMYGKRVLEWTFNNILLPDSNVNEAKSHGFVTFTVEQNRNLANGTEITNTAGIYFDFNAPIITNTTVHTVNETVQSVVSSIKPVSLSLSKTKGLIVYPNPATNELTVSVDASIAQHDSKVEIYNVIGEKMLEARSKKLDSSIPQSDSSVVVDISDLPKGMYVVKSGTEAVKLVVE